ncbi:MAG: hypothetical protein IPM68_01520 [Flavobacteriales bacterium]|nr:hypothetical protein [Flavobacteriales bacterium]
MITDTALVVAGGFQEMDSVPNTQWVAQWKQDAWHSMGIASGTTGSCSALRLDTLGGELHLFGPCQFGTSPAMSNWLTWDGGQWRQYDPDEPFYGYTAAACRYQGQVHVAGNFWTVNGATDVARYTGSTWEELGPGVAGDPFMTDMLVYDDLLWVCGDIAASAGNPANALLAWDGAQWLDLSRASPTWRTGAICWWPMASCTTRAPSWPTVSIVPTRCWSTTGNRCA